MEHYRFVLACPSIGLPFSRRPFLCSVSVFFHSPPTSVLFNFFVPPSFYISFLVCTSSHPFLCLAFFLPHVPFILFLFHPGLFLSLFRVSYPRISVLIRPFLHSALSFFFFYPLPTFFMSSTISFCVRELRVGWVWYGILSV